ncbi:hypothetical protein ACWGMA_32150 [Streptomyces asiaticus]
MAGEIGPAGLVEEALFDAFDRERTASGWTVHIRTALDLADRLLNGIIARRMPRC